MSLLPASGARRQPASLVGAMIAVLSAVASAACGGGEVASARPSAPAAPSVSSPPPPRVVMPEDPLGPVPSVAVVPPFRPPVPAVYTTPNGMTVWLLERHALPIVAVTVVVPSGAASDPKGEAGLADQAAQMLCAGAGKRDALELARAVDDLGAKLEAGVTLDSSDVHLGVVKRGFAPGMQLLGDVIVRPRWEPGEWKRLHELWMNELKERAGDPEAVAQDVASALLFGKDHPYGHPVFGLLATASRVQLADAKRFWAQAWRPDRATVVVVGDVTKTELDEQLEVAFGGWKPPVTPPSPLVAPPLAGVSEGAPASATKARVVLVDRPDAPHTLVELVRPALTAGDPSYPPLYRANIAFGGSLTSRLIGDLRQVHGWAYAAESRVTAERGAGFLSVKGAFVTEKTADALRAMLADLDAFARGGMTEDEASKTRMQARSAIVAEYETVDRTSAALAHDAALGLGPDYEERSSALSDQADRAALGALVAKFFDPAGAVIVVVGPAAKLESQLGELAQAGFGPVEHFNPEGAPGKGVR